MPKSDDFIDDNGYAMHTLHELMSIDTSGIVGGLNYIEARIELIQAYDADFGLDTGYYNVAIPNEEKFTPKSLYDYWADKYDLFKIWDRWHINFDEYLQRPSFMIEALNAAAERCCKREKEEAERLKQQLEAEKKKANH